MRQGGGLGQLGAHGTGGGGLTIYQDSGTFAAQLTVASATSHDGWLGLANGSGATRVYARGANPRLDAALDRRETLGGFLCQLADTPCRYADALDSLAKVTEGAVS